MSSLIGVGGGFLLVPIMIYIRRYACPISARHISFYNDIYYDIRCTASRNKPRYRWYLFSHYTGSRKCSGAQVGTKIGMKLKNEEIRATMSILVLIFGLKFGYDLFFGKIIPHLSKTSSSLTGSDGLAGFVINTAQTFLEHMR